MAKAKKMTLTETQTKVNEAVQKQEIKKDVAFRAEYEALCKKYSRRVVGVARKVPLENNIWADEVGEAVRRFPSTQ